MDSIFYIHGFASVGNGDKSQSLRNSFPHLKIFSPDLPVHTIETKDIIEKIITEEQLIDPIFVGTSMGGFWSLYFSQKLQKECYIVNPAIHPSITLANRVDTVLKNYKTQEDIIVSKKNIFDLMFLEGLIYKNLNTNLINLFLAKDDELIYFADTLNKLNNSKNLTLTEDGGHRYELHWDKVITSILNSK